MKKGVDWSALVNISASITVNIQLTMAIAVKTTTLSDPSTSTEISTSAPHVVVRAVHPDDEILMTQPSNADTTVKNTQDENPVDPVD